MRLDVVIVLDASTSMLEQVSPSRRKIDLAVDGVQTFLAGLRLGSADRASLVVFNDHARVLVPLTGDRAALLDGLENIEVRQFTRLDLGLETAADELRRGASGTLKAVVGLSDGWVNPVPPAAAVEASRTVKADGAALYMIAFGNDADEQLLMAIADPGRYVKAGDPTSITSVYRDLTRRVPCPPEAYWGRR